MQELKSKFLQKFSNIINDIYDDYDEKLESQKIFYQFLKLTKETMGISIDEIINSNNLDKFLKCVSNFHFKQKKEVIDLFKDDIQNNLFFSRKLFFSLNNSFIKNDDTLLDYNNQIFDYYYEIITESNIISQYSTNDFLSNRHYVTQKTNHKTDFDYSLFSQNLQQHDIPIKSFFIQNSEKYTKFLIQYYQSSDKTTNLTLFPLKLIFESKNENLISTVLSELNIYEILKQHYLRNIDNSYNEILNIILSNDKFVNLFFKSYSDQNSLGYVKKFEEKSHFLFILNKLIDNNHNHKIQLPEHFFDKMFFEIKKDRDFGSLILKMNNVKSIFKILFFSAYDKEFINNLISSKFISNDDFVNFDINFIESIKNLKLVSKFFNKIDNDVKECFLNVIHNNTLSYYKDLSSELYSVTAKKFNDVLLLGAFIDNSFIDKILTHTNDKEKVFSSTIDNGKNGKKKIKKSALADFINNNNSDVFLPIIDWFLKPENLNILINCKIKKNHIFDEILSNKALEIATHIQPKLKQLNINFNSEFIFKAHPEALAKLKFESIQNKLSEKIKTSPINKI